MHDIIRTEKVVVNVQQIIQVIHELIHYQTVISYQYVEVPMEELILKIFQSILHVLDEIMALFQYLPHDMLHGRVVYEVIQ